MWWMLSFPTRHDLVRQRQRLEYFTIAYNSAESPVSIVAGSVSLVGFGLDSIIEVFSGAALLRRLHHDLNRSGREQLERILEAALTASLRISAVAGRLHFVLEEPVEI
jgi:hypothetical protein